MSVLMAWLRIAFGLVFLVAALPKAADPAAFASIVANYQILPELLVNPVALLLPWIEAVCGAALVAGAFPRGASLVLNALLVVFIAALWFNLSRGLDVLCGCFSVAPAAAGGTRELIIRDAVLLGVGLVVMIYEIWRERRRLASEALWQAVTNPKGATFGEPRVKNGVLVIGEDAPTGPAWPQGGAAAGLSGQEKTSPAEDASEAADEKADADNGRVESDESEDPEITTGDAEEDSVERGAEDDESCADAPDGCSQKKD